MIQHAIPVCHWIYNGVPINEFLQKCLPLDIEKNKITICLIVKSKSVLLYFAQDAKG